MKRLFPFLFLLLSMTVPAAGDGQTTAQMMEKIRAKNDPDTARYFALTEKVLAQAEGNDSVAVECLHNRLKYEATYGLMERAKRSLELLQSFYERTGKFEAEFFDSWNKIADTYFNLNRSMESMAEIRKMQQFAQEKKSDIGLANVYICYGTLFSSSYDSSIENLKKAEAYLKKANALEGNYSFYLSLAYTALMSAQYKDLLEFVVQMLQAQPDNEYLIQVAENMQLIAYLALRNKPEATTSYNRLKKIWDDHKIDGNMLSNVAYSMVAYQCEMGDPDLAPQFMEFISDDYADQKLDAQVKYYTAKGNHKKALDLMFEYKNVMENVQAEQQAADIAKANAFFNNQQLEMEKRQIQLDSTRRQNNLLCIIAFAFFLIGAAAVYIALSTRRHNKQLKTERDKVEVERNKAVLLSEMKSTFINNMSHEVRTPLNSIVGFNDLLNTPDYEFSQEEKDAMVAEICVQTNNLIDLLNNVILLSRLDGHDIQPQLEDCHLSEIWYPAYDAATNLHQPRVPIDTESIQNADITLRTDRSLLISAITNVLDNAIKFTSEGSIKVEATQQGPSVLITITDTGDGIPEDKAELIFERFEKLGRMEQGFGLGLSIARESLALIGGTIRLDTSYRDGTRFVIDLKSL